MGTLPITTFEQLENQLRQKFEECRAEGRKEGLENLIRQVNVLKADLVNQEDHTEFGRGQYSGYERAEMIAIGILSK